MTCCLERVVPVASSVSMGVLSQHSLFGNLFTSAEPKDYNAVGEMESAFVWPSLNKELHCGAEEVAVLWRQSEPVS